ncbi:Serine/threonine-protein kinase haspin hrk1 [Staphylotrichum tortipilum]|uniref:non-specific serine/threonine protein kinase n=1 Tax=Staphylotrichum tortipilum TaxID=2831512 RepID=A0AAN6MKP4_9PEZI|nr:Serine/threonine-protein kinase haspin hrk1 [Staphylotrichum longicolle]
MSRTTTVRKYGKSTRKPKQTAADDLFAQLPRTPVKGASKPDPEPELEPAREPSLDLKAALEDEITELEAQLQAARLDDTPAEKDKTEAPRPEDGSSCPDSSEDSQGTATQGQVLEDSAQDDCHHEAEDDADQLEEEDKEQEESSIDSLRVLSWTDVCASGDGIEKIAEASFAEVYRVTNAHGTSIIKVVRLESPIKAQTKAQARSGLVDEEPHAEAAMAGELRISEWLADVPGFVVYKEQYVVEGRAPRALLETHQAFQRRAKRRDPDRLQFYPSPSRYLEETRFLVVELGDAGVALEDFELTTVSQVWDIFLHTALALARAEDMIEFEHRDLHEGNLCIRRVRPPTTPPHPQAGLQFGHSGLDITILDYGLSRATDPFPSPTTPEAEVVAYDLETDLLLFQSTHAAQCRVYRQMRTFLLHHDRVRSLPAEQHTTPYPVSPATGEPISWRGHFPYTNVLWLAYLYGYLVENFKGPRAEVKRFVRETGELRAHLDPGAPRGVLSFPGAGEVVRFAVEAGWVEEGQVVDAGGGWGGEGGWVGERNGVEG